MSEKIDPHKHKESYLNWKKKGKPLEGLCEADKALLIKYLDDMEQGINVSLKAKKGSRSYGVLRNQRSKLTTMFRNTYNEYKIPVTELDDEKLLRVFYKMRNGDIISESGRKYSATGAFVKSFKSFWNWWIKVNRKKGQFIIDITEDADKRDPKPKWNYLTIEDVKKLCDNALPKYRMMMMFLFDSGIRAPTEMMNTRVKDLQWNKEQDYYTLHIRDEIAKTFGRKIKLLKCSSLLKSYISDNQLKSSDYLFTGRSQKINEYLARLGFRILNIGEKSQKVDSGKKNGVWVSNGLRLYDFRHSSACYWVSKYKNESSLKYRFGWVKSDKIKYYTEFLGMKDTLSQEDLYDDVTKTELEQKISSIEQESTIKEEALQKEIQELRKQISEIASKLA